MTRPPKAGWSRATKLLLAAVALALALATSLPSGALAGGADGSKPVVVATTSVLASIVNDLAGDLVRVELIASPAVCPAHYDVKPSDVEKVRSAQLVLFHGVEPWVQSLIEAAGVQVPSVKLSGGWNTPAQLKDRYRAVAQALESHLGLRLEDRLSKCIDAIGRVEGALKGLAEEHGFKGVPVVAMRWQSPFVEFLGFRVVASYGPPETVTARLYEAVVSNATREGALLVVDNVQSGVELGESIAREVGAVHVALTNFPWVAPEVRNVTDAMLYNARSLAKALGEARVKGELLHALREVELWRALSIALGGVAVALAAGLAASVVKLRRR